MLGLWVDRARRFVPVLCLVVMGACESPPPPLPPLPELAFTKYQPIALNVASIDVIEEYKYPAQAPNVEHLMPLAPMDGIKAWVRDRLKAAGQEKSLQVIVKDASVISSEPPMDPKAGLLAARPNKRYDAKLEIELRVYGTDAMSEANISVVATQMITLSEKASAEERKRAYHRMVYDLMESANAELEKQIFTHFSQYIVYSQTP